MCEKCSDNIYLHVLLYLNSNFSEVSSKQFDYMQIQYSQCNLRGMYSNCLECILIQRIYERQTEIAQYVVV
jgi:hypothetical protein